MIGIVVLNYRRWDETIKCVNSIYENQPSENQPFKIYIVDNGSPNEPPEEFCSLIRKSEIYYIRNEKNRGYAAGNNIGIKRALEDNCDYIVVSNSDIYFQKNTFDEIVLFYATHTGISFPKIYTIDGDISPVAERYFCFVEEMYHFCTPFKLFRCDIHNIDIHSEIPFQTHLNIGPCFMMDQRTAGVLTPLDENTTLYFEEMILSRNADRSHIGIYYIPSCVVIHGEGKSTGNANAFAQMCYAESAIYYMRKYLNVNKLKTFPMYMYFKIAFLIKALRNSEYRNLYNIFSDKLRSKYKMN